MEFLTRSWASLVVGVGVGVLVLGCAPEFEVDLSIVDRAQVLALAATPAEVAPGETVTLSALIAAPDGTVVDTPIDWSLCIARRPLAAVGPIAPECVALRKHAIDPLGFGVTVDAEIPDDACRLFGPEPPPAMPGEPTGRPVDPDLTGGYYQPVLGLFGVDDQALNVLSVRLACGLAGATQAQSAEYTANYVRNLAPAVLEFGVDDGSNSVEVGSHVELRVAWTGAETHVFFDPIDLEVETRREAISVAWYTSAGEFDDPRTGRSSEDQKTTSNNGWRAPMEIGTVHLWVVLRDDRGGTGWADLELQVVP